MKIYTYIKMDIFTGEVLEEISYEYKGVFDECKGGDGGAREQAEKSYKLQLEQLELQKAQLAELATKEQQKKFGEQQLLETRLKRRTGRRGTILTDIGNFGAVDVLKKSLYA